MAVDDLETALVALRAAIPDIPAPPPEACGRCYPADFVAPLAGPRDQVPDDLLASVAMKEQFHWDRGEGLVNFTALYSWLAPRIVGDLVHDELGVDGAWIAHRLGAAGVFAVGSEAGRAHDEVTVQWWLAVLRGRRAGDVMTVLEYVAPFHPDLEPYLALWDAEPPGPADAHALALLGYWLPELSSGELDVGWLGDVDISAPLTRWVLGHGAARAERHGLDADTAAGLAYLRELDASGPVVEEGPAPAPEVSVSVDAVRLAPRRRRGWPGRGWPGRGWQRRGWQRRG